MKNEDNLKIKQRLIKKSWFDLHPDTKKSITAVILFLLGVIFVLSYFGKAGPAGRGIYWATDKLLGVGYAILPVILFAAAATFILSVRRRLYAVTFIGMGLLLFSLLGLIDIGYARGSAGYFGEFSGSLKYLFGNAASVIVLFGFAVIACLLMANISLVRKKKTEDERAAKPIKINENLEPANDGGLPKDKSAPIDNKESKDDRKEDEVVIKENKPQRESELLKAGAAKREITYSGFRLPSLELLDKEGGKPNSGDIKANANIIRRTLENFGIPVEMGEVNVGPTVTQYTLKPAQGVKLSKILALQNDLSLALAAHPIRLEAPIPGKSLVGIEVPNKAMAVVKLRHLLAYDFYRNSGHWLTFAVGRDVTGEPHFGELEKLPHLLIAGATGSGKSVFIHGLLLSLFYKNSPDTLKLILIDPKRVELSVYNDLAYLMTPVITDGKKSVIALRWIVKEMERRYEVLLEWGSRDISSYNERRISRSEQPMPYIVIVIDELADLMAAYGRDVEGFIVRIAQMARATGIHLIIATQRPSVEVITGLIKANITSRVAFQVASQVDSRTILDMAGADKLLGSGDMLFMPGDSSKPRRLQAAFVSEKEITRVVGFLKEESRRFMREQGDEAVEGELRLDNGVSAGLDLNGNSQSMLDFENESFGDEDDELYPEAERLVVEAGKASASLLQRRLRVGYARAARLLDILEERGVIGPGDGAKPREIYKRETSV